MDPGKRKMSPERKETLLGLQRQILSLEVNLLLNNFTVDRTWTKPITEKKFSLLSM
jgi:hypothetical protein